MAKKVVSASATDAMRSDLDARIERLEAVYALNNIIGKYEGYFNVNRFDKIPDLFAKKTPGVSAEITDGGVWVGWDSIYKLYAKFHASFMTDVVGHLCEHDVTTPVVEVAKDLKTARALWTSPGLMNRRDDTGKLFACWLWAKYRGDFIKEDGEWKIWHWHVYLTFRTPFDKGWVEEPVVGSFSPPKEWAADKPPTSYMPFHPGRRNVMGPPPPEPYDTWTDDFLPC
jgi:hypothetical protein